ncbi:MAG TPA: hypothetical protein VHX65_14465 [Pirellulales bacterium]|jgi:hypothetical protein|nr:hypothetical protein [Pirellulales bacterium]
MDEPRERSVAVLLARGLIRFRRCAGRSGQTAMRADDESPKATVQPGAQPAPAKPVPTNLQGEQP